MSVSDIKTNTSLNDIKIAFIADDIRNITEFELVHNATFALMLAAQNLNVKVLFTESNNLKIVKNKIVAKFDEVILKREVGNHLKIKSSDEYFLDSLNIIFARKDPPVNEKYISYIQILSLLSDKQTNDQHLPPIINKPEGILKANEKLYALNFPEFIPPTLVSSKKAELLNFLNEYKEVVIKPLFNNSGEGVLYLSKDDRNASHVIEANLQSDAGMLLVQKYIPDVMSGDKRIILLNGVPIGAILRIPKAGEFRTNIHRGASVAAYELSRRDLEICEALKSYLLRDGLYFTAIDVIADSLIEINVTSPAGLQEVEQCTGSPVAKEIIEWAIEKVIYNKSMMTSR
jgi:glutathione synthase